MWGWAENGAVTEGFLLNPAEEAEEVVELCREICLVIVPYWEPGADPGTAEMQEPKGTKTTWAKQNTNNNLEHNAETKSKGGKRKGVERPQHSKHMKIQIHLGFMRQIKKKTRINCVFWGERKGFTLANINIYINISKDTVLHNSIFMMNLWELLCPFK